MDPYSAGMILRQLLQSAGLKATIALVVVVGVMLVAYKGMTYLMGAVERMMSARDAQLSTFLNQMVTSNGSLMGQIADGNRTRAAMDQATAKVLENIAGHLANNTDELRRFRDEHGANQAGLLAQFGELEKVMAEIKGKVG